MKKICGNCSYYKPNNKYQGVGMCSYLSSPISIVIGSRDYDSILKHKMLYKEYKVKTLHVRTDNVCRFFSKIKQIN